MTFWNSLASLFARPASVSVAEGPRLANPSPVVLPAGARFSACLAEVLKHEGGYANHPDDPGGATNLGITHRTLAAWRSKPVTRADVRALTVAEAAAIYRANYWNKVRGDDLPPGVDLVVFDFAVNSGPAKAAMVLQKVLGVADDGVIGPVTLAALSKAPRATLITELSDERMRFLRRLSTWPSFGRGWTRRVGEVEAAALEAAG